MGGGGGSVVDAGPMDPGGAPDASCWSSPRALSGTTRSVTGPADFAVDATGRVVAAWHENTGNGIATYVATVLADGGLIAATQLGSDAGFAPKVAVAVSTTGEAVVVWNQSPNGGLNVNDLHLSRFRPASGWAESEVVSVLTNTIDEPAVAMDEVGRIIVAWSQPLMAQGPQNIWSRGNVADGGWSTPTRLDTDAMSNSSGLHLAVSPVGRAIAAWSQGNGNNHVMASTYSPTVGWVTARQVDLATVNVADPNAAIADDGSALVTWRDFRGGGEWNAMVAEYDGGAWSGPIDLDRDDAGTSLKPVPAINTRGDAVVVFLQAPDTTWLMSSARVSPGVWAPSVPVVASTFTSYGNAAVALNDQGLGVLGYDDSSTPYVLRLMQPPSLSVSTIPGGLGTTGPNVHVAITPSGQRWVFFAGYANGAAVRQVYVSHCP